MNIEIIVQTVSGNIYRADAENISEQGLNEFRSVLRDWHTMKYFSLGNQSFNPANIEYVELVVKS